MIITKDFYTAIQLSKASGVNKSTLLLRCQKLNIPKVKRGFTHIYLIPKESIPDLIGAENIDTYAPEIIYVTRTTEIYQSKLNFLTLEQL